jgi:GT2 family glycosyltransferase
MTSAPSLAIGFATIDRPHVAQRLIRSIREHFGKVAIYVADQSAQVDAMLPYYAANDVYLIRMPYDVGVTTSRNRLVSEMTEEYFVLCDDDFILGHDTQFGDAIRILELDREIGVVGGRLYDFDGAAEWLRNWELFLQYDRLNRILFSIPIYELAPKVRELGSIRYYLCDAVLNFSVFRRSIFSDTVKWDEQFKSNGEHEDFYLNLKVNSPVRVAYLPTMRAYHHHPEEYLAYRQRLRDRNEGWRLFFEKWGLDQHIEFGAGVRTIDDVATVVAAEDATARFFINPDLSLQRAAPMENGLLVGNFEQIVPIGVSSSEGDKIPRTSHTGMLLLDGQAQKIVPMAVAPPADGTKVRSPIERYRFGLRGEVPTVSGANSPLQFRYDPILRPDRDFFLWYAVPKAATADDLNLAVTLRWSASDGSVVVWRTPRQHLELTSAGFWRPLLVETPLLPLHSRWLRFDLITDGGPSPDPVCTGFLFDTPFRAARDGPAPGPEVLAFGRLTNDGAARGGAGRALEDVGKVCRRLPATLTGSASSQDLALLGLESAPGLEVLFFTGFDCLGRELVSAVAPQPNPPAPKALGLPSMQWWSPKAAIYGYGARIGFVALDVQREGAPHAV